MVMNFHYHGLTKMPSGETVTPATLNTWLLSQTDGFIGDGLINWMAVTRLSRLINEVYGTPKLEYERHDGSSTTAAIQALNNKLLPILSIPGHFLIANGTLNNGTDFSIVDPGYTYTSFTQHKASLLSTRVLVPSFTDLSYIMITHDPRLTVQILDTHTKQPVSTVSTQIEYLDADDGAGEKNYALATTQLAKPSTGNYLVKISASTDPVDPTVPLSPTQRPTKIYTYSQTAEVNHWVVPNPTGTEPAIYWLQYAKEAHSTVKPLVSFATLKQTIDLAYTQKQISSRAAWQKLSTAAQQGHQSPAGAQSRYGKLLKQYLAIYKTYLSPATYSLLDGQLNQLSTQLAW
jgi:hypothetical protein